MWEKIAGYAWSRYITEFETRAIGIGKQLAGAPGVALDVGCGGGRWSQILHDDGWRLVCTDVSPDAIAHVKALFPDARCELTNPDATKLPCDTASIQLVTCMEVFQVSGQDWFADEVLRVLEPGGTLVSVFNNRSSLRGLFGRIKHRLNLRDYDPYHRSWDDWQAALSLRGLRIVHAEGLCWFPFSRLSNSPLTPAVARIERTLGLTRLVRWSPWIVYVAKLSKDTGPAL